MYNSILLAADGSKNSIRAAQELLNFIGDYTIVTILTVVDIEESKTDVLHDHQGTNLTQKRESKLQSIKDLFTVSNSGEYQAIILGTRGLNSFQKMVLGSVSHKVAKRSQIPVIIVK